MNGSPYNRITDILFEVTDSAGNIGTHQISVTYTPTNPTITYTYDKNGNLITRQASSIIETFTHDLENRLKTYSGPTQSATYTYNGLDKDNRDSDHFIKDKSLMDISSSPIPMTMPQGAQW